MGSVTRAHLLWAGGVGEKDWQRDLERILFVEFTHKYLSFYVSLLTVTGTFNPEHLYIQSYVFDLLYK